MLDAIRDGLINKVQAECPSDPQERANHLKAFAYFADTTVAGCCELTAQALLSTPALNPDIDRLADDLKTRQTKTLASGIDMIMADLKESMEAPPTTIDAHARPCVRHLPAAVLLGRRPDQETFLREGWRPLAGDGSGWDRP